jgi:predicted lysophospholipase L1 biosynthesis ABC-type transport system permease subunit
MSNPREVIGVVSDVRSVANLNNVEGSFQFYRALAQWNQNFATIALRPAAPASLAEASREGGKPGERGSRRAPAALAQELRRVIAEIDPDQAVYRITTVRHEIERGLGSFDAAAYALVGFAILGVLLAAVGIYGVIANSVVQRTNEIGIRMALGAQVRDILSLVLGGGLRLTLIGTALGLAGAWLVARLLRLISVEFATTDPALTVSITAFLILVAMVACYLPARRAAQVDPISALRAE